MMRPIAAPTMPEIFAAEKIPTRLICIFAMSNLLCLGGVFGSQVEEAETRHALALAQRLRQKVFERLLVRRALPARAVWLQLVGGFGARVFERVFGKRLAQRAVEQRLDVRERVLQSFRVRIRRTLEVRVKLFESNGRASKGFTQRFVARAFASRIESA